MKNKSFLKVAKLIRIHKEPTKNRHVALVKDNKNLGVLFTAESNFLTSFWLLL
jgi:hypothetical protein